MLKNKQSSLSWVLVILLVLGFLVVVLRTAWVSDDAYITFRSVENFIHGYGPVYNIDERLQNFTHPLWFFIQSGANAITQRIGAINPWAQMYYVSLFLSISLSVAAVLILVLGIARSSKSAILALLVLILSKVFIDYCTSGLENALTFLILAIFLWLYFLKLPDSRKLFLLSFTTAMGGLNRFDTLLLYLPALVYLVWQNKTRMKVILLMAVGFLPLVAWEIFSVFYYGFPFPNTAYAKLNTGISTLALIRQGFRYTESSFRLDPFTILLIAVLLIWFLWKGPKGFYPILIGVIAYILYIFYIGGDFMAGRFFSPVIFVLASLLSMLEYSNNRVYATLVLSVLFFGLLYPLSPPRSPLDFGSSPDRQNHINEYGVADERAYYYPSMGLYSSVRQKAPPGSNYSGQKWIYHKDEPMKIAKVGPLGVTGYMAGPNKHVVDANALADPLMVRMPLIYPAAWRIGHFKHIIPEGYLETLKTGKNVIKDPGVAEYYNKLALVTRGNLLDPKRLVEIWNLNTGKYNYLLNNFWKPRN